MLRAMLSFKRRPNYHSKHHIWIKEALKIPNWANFLMSFMLLHSISKHTAWLKSMFLVKLWNCRNHSELLLSILKWPELRFRNNSTFSKTITKTSSHNCSTQKSEKIELRVNIVSLKTNNWVKTAQETIILDAGSAARAIRTQKTQNNRKPKGH